MVVNREWAEWQVRLCEDGIASRIEWAGKGLISESSRDADIDFFESRVVAPKRLLDILDWRE